MGKKAVCPTGKTQFTKKEAFTAVNTIKHIKLRAYHCKCNWWHVTHVRAFNHKKKKTKAKNEQSRRFEEEKRCLEIDRPETKKGNPIDSLIYKERFRKFLNE